MGVTRAVLVCVMLCNVIRANFFSDKSRRDVGAKIVQDEAKNSRMSHRVQLLFPLLLRISTRLATLVPTAVMSLIGIFLFVAFSKKAFIISLLVLFLTYLDKYKRDDNIIHIYKINRFNEGEEEIHYGRPYRKIFVHVGKEPPEYRSISHYGTVDREEKPYHSWIGLRKGRYKNVNRSDYNNSRTMTTDSRQFLSQSIYAGDNSLRYF